MTEHISDLGQPMYGTKVEKKPVKKTGSRRYISNAELIKFKEE